MCWVRSTLVCVIEPSKNKLELANPQIQGDPGLPRCWLLTGKVILVITQGCNVVQKCPAQWRHGDSVAVSSACGVLSEGSGVSIGAIHLLVGTVSWFPVLWVSRQFRVALP